MKKILRGLSIFSFVMWFLFYSCVFFLFIKNNFDMEFLPRIENILSSMIPFYNMGILGIVFLSVTGLLYFLAGLQTYHNRTSGYFWFLSLAYINIISSILYYVVFFWTPDMPAVILNLIIGIFFLKFFFNEKVMENFNISKKLKKRILRDKKNLYLLVAVVFSIHIVVFIFFKFTEKDFFEETDVLYKSSKEEKKVFKRRIVGDKSIELPPELVLTHIELQKGSIDYFNMLSVDRGLFLIFNLEPYTNRLYKRIGAMTGYRDGDDFLHNFFFRDLGLIHLFIKKIRGNTFRGMYQKVELSDGNTILQYRGKGSEKLYNEFHIYDEEEDRIFAIYFINDDSDSFNIDDLYRTMSSYKRSYLPENIDSFYNNKNENIYQLSFDTINRLLLYQKDYKAIFEYARVFERIDFSPDKSNTKKFLRQCLKINPDYEPAQIMFSILESR